MYQEHSRPPIIEMCYQTDGIGRSGVVITLRFSKSLAPSELGIARQGPTIYSQSA